MSRLESDVLFNRALLWGVMACIMSDHGNELFSWVFFFFSAHSVWKSYVEWGNGE